jgi:2'-5' RNA ligase
MGIDVVENPNRENGGGVASMAKTESALVVLVPEAEALLRLCRARYDPEALIDMPAHITLIYPFKPPADIDAGTLAALDSCCANLARFDFALARLECFEGDALYLAPEPDEPFRRLTVSLWRLYPDRPPYGGRYPTIVPHLTLLRLAGERRLASIAADLAASFGHRLPIRAHAGSVALLDTNSGRWEVRALFELM